MDEGPRRVGPRKNTTNSTRRQPERERERKRTKLRAGEGKKERNLGGPAEGGPARGRSGGRSVRTTQTHTHQTNTPNQTNTPTKPTHQTKTTQTHTPNQPKHTHQTNTPTKPNQTNTPTKPNQHTNTHTNTHRCRVLSRIPFFILSRCRFFCPVCLFFCDRIRPSLFGHIWPNRIWPIPHLTELKWPHLANLFWPNLANFVDRIWPERIWPSRRRGGRGSKGWVEGRGGRRGRGTFVPESGQGQ